MNLDTKEKKLPGITEEADLSELTEKGNLSNRAEESAISGRIEELELNLLRQEHRPIQVLYNLWSYRHDVKKRDPSVWAFISWLFSPVVDMIIDTWLTKWVTEEIRPDVANAIKWLLGICVCYLTISIVIRTRDDVRFVIPYVEFAKQTKGSRPLVLDTSALIDGRIVDLC